MFTKRIAQRVVRYCEIARRMGVPKDKQVADLSLIVDQELVGMVDRFEQMREIAKETVNLKADVKLLSQTIAQLHCELILRTGTNN